MKKRALFAIAVLTSSVASLLLSLRNQQGLSSYALSTVSASDPPVEWREETHVNVTNATTVPPNLPVVTSRAHRNITMLVRLRGEMGNNLGALAHAYAVKLSIERSYPGIVVSLVGQHQGQNAKKWKSAAQNLRKCFPVFRDFQFEGGRWDEEFRNRRRQQDAWLLARSINNDTSTKELLSMDGSCARRGPCWRETAANLVTLLQEQAENPDELSIQEASTANVSLPFLSSSAFSIFDELTDEFYDEIRQWLRLDEGKCCQARPDKDESVFHLRNFAAESKKLLKKGYQEMSANSTADELFSNLGPGDKVAIVSRFKNNLQPYVTALEGKGLRVRVIEDQSAVQDFCFLQSVRKELVGAKMSTFVAWAGFLGNMERIRLYAVNSTWTQKRGAGFFKHYQSSQKELQKRLSFETYQQ